jgi:hypothetical protein
MRPRSTNNADALALSALATTLTDERRAQRFLDLSGIDTDELRRRAAEPALLAALIRFLEAHEPDLIDVAESIGVAPHELVAAREELER